ncbi:hypothetical protein JCM5350_008345 [Sporobolomyces pararoseus]
MSELTISTTANYKTEIVWMLSKEEIALIREHDAAGTKCEIVKQVDNAAWKLSFETKCEDDENPYLYLWASPQPEDLKLASSTKSWAREGSYIWTISFILSEPDPAMEPQRMKVAHIFDAAVFAWGRPLNATSQKIVQLYETKESLGFRFSIEHEHLPQCRSPARKTLLDLLDNPRYADTVFVIHGNGEQTSRIVACEEILTAASSYFETLFKWGFAETTLRMIQDFSSFLPSAPDRTTVASMVRDDMAPFAPSNSTVTSPAGTAAIRSPSPTLVNIATDASLMTVEDGHTGVTGRDGSGYGKTCKAVGIYETDYFTYRAMLAHLHTMSTPFFYDPMRLLLKLDLLNLQSPALFDSQLQHSLEQIAADTKAHPLWEGVESCSSHAMYRLSDRYSLDELRESSLGYIVRSLTVETVAYALFSPLSLDYDQVQQPIFEFFLRQWEEVKVTKGFERVLEKFSSGELPKGKNLIAAIFEKMKAS